MKLSIIIALVLSSFVFASALPYPSNREEWLAFKNEFGKTYSSEEEENLRMKIFQDNKLRLEKHNALFTAGLISYSVGINKFSDLTFTEINEKLTGYRRSPQRQNALLYTPSKAIEVPNEVDWRSKGAVTSVKNQGDCGSCWAFSTTGVLEGQNFLTNGKLVSLSEQNLVDCEQNNFGCGGGDPQDAYNYIISNKGIDTEGGYPYTALNGRCRFSNFSVGARITGYTNIPEGDESSLKVAVADQGPISICIYASNLFTSYDKGVFYEEYCPNGFTELNHCVLIVGYGTENGQDYWLVKNSWGESWGEQGYIKMSRGKNNNCGIATEATYPTVVKT